MRYIRIRAPPPTLTFLEKGGVYMPYIKAHEEKKWRLWKFEEEELLRNYNVSEQIISQLRDFDWIQFNEERRFREHQIVNSQLIEAKVSIELNINSIYDLLSQIEDEQIYKIMSLENELMLNIIFLKINGYTVKEISSQVGLSEESIRKRIRNIRKKLKK